MTSWGHNAFRIGRSAALNSDVVGGARSYDNCSGVEHRIVIRLRPCTLDRSGWIRLFRRKVPDAVLCVVDTGATASVFGGDIAEALDLKIADPQLREMRLACGQKISGWWCRHKIGLDLGPAHLEVRVWFAVESVEHDGVNMWRYRRDLPAENLLGMTDVLSQRMLCCTPAALFVFARRG